MKLLLDRQTQGIETVREFRYLIVLWLRGDQLIYAMF